MQKTLIDPFELAARILPAYKASAAPKHNLVPKRNVEPVEIQAGWAPAPRGEAWSRVRCWCSEE